MSVVTCAGCEGYVDTDFVETYEVCGICLERLGDPKGGLIKILKAAIKLVELETGIQVDMPTLKVRKTYALTELVDEVAEYAAENDIKSI